MKSLNDYIDTPQKKEEFKRALDRALNTWGDGPKWLFELADDIEAEKVFFEPSAQTIKDTVSITIDVKPSNEFTAVLEQLKMTRLSVDTAMKLLTGAINVR